MKKASVLAASLIYCFSVLAVESAENYGKFSEPLKWEVVKAKPRDARLLLKEFKFVDPNGFLWTAPSGQKVDGASIPRFLWSIVGGPYSGPYLRAAVIHDYYCCMRSRTSFDTHRNFYYGMRAVGMPRWQANLMHWGVSSFGPDWENPPADIWQKISANSTKSPVCIYKLDSNGDPIGNNYFDYGSTYRVSVPQRSRIAAIRKTVGVAKILKSTDGKYIDLVEGQLVEATPENIQQRAQITRRMIEDGRFTVDAAEFGFIDTASMTDVVRDFQNLSAVSAIPNDQLNNFQNLIDQSIESLRSPNFNSDLPEERFFDYQAVEEDKFEIPDTTKWKPAIPKSEDEKFTPFIEWKPDSVDEVYNSNPDLMLEWMRENPTEFRGILDLERSGAHDFLQNNPDFLGDILKNNPALMERQPSFN